MKYLILKNDYFILSFLAEKWNMHLRPLYLRETLYFKILWSVAEGKSDLLL